MIPQPKLGLRFRLPILALVILSMMAGLWAALARVGWSMPELRPTLTGIHGHLMIGGVLGSLITLERAVALAGLAGRRWHWSYLAPMSSAAGAILLVWWGAEPLPKLLITGGSLGLVVIFRAILRRHFATYTLVMTLGGVAWLTSNLGWLTNQPTYQLVHWWIAFLILTIVGERLELSRIRRTSSRASGMFTGAVGVYLVGVVLTLFALDGGVRLAGIGQVLLALWLFRYDIAGQTIRKRGLPRFVAACLLVGYGWLAVGGALGMIFGAVYAGFQYDALLHSLLLGFVFSMIFGHAPIIFPAITARPIQYSPLFYLYLGLLHLSLLVRVGGSLTASLEMRQWGGLLNVIAVLVFLGATFLSLRRAPQPITH